MKPNDDNKVTYKIYDKEDNIQYSMYDGGIWTNASFERVSESMKHISQMIEKMQAEMYNSLFVSTASMEGLSKWLK